MIVLNPSRLTRLLRCEYEGYAYAILRIFKRARSSSEAADRGKAFHALLEKALKHYAKTGNVFAYEGEEGLLEAADVFDELFQSEGLSFDEDYAAGIVEAARFHIPRLNLSQWEVLEIDGEPAIEIDLRAPSLTEGVQLQAIIDVVFRHRKTGEIWLVDWKTTMYAIDTRKMPPYIPRPDYQLALQRRVLAHHGIVPDVSTLLSLRSVAPQEPPLTLKQKKVSRNLNDLTCDWPTYERALEQHGEDPTDAKYDKVRESLACSVFSRWRHDVSTDVEREHVNKALDNLCEQLARLAAGEVAPVRALQSARVPRSRMCDGCDYDLWCRAGLRDPSGVDTSLLSVDYVAGEDSPLRGPVKLAAPFDRDGSYVSYALERGHTIQPSEELSP